MCNKFFKASHKKWWLSVTPRFLSKHLFQVVQLMGLVVQKLGLSIRAISDKIAAEASHRVLKFLKWNHDRG